MRVRSSHPPLNSLALYRRCAFTFIFSGLVPVRRFALRANSLVVLIHETHELGIDLVFWANKAA